MRLKVKKISSRRVHKGQMLDFFVDRVSINGVRTVREYTGYPEAAGVIPLLADGRIIMIEQYRYTNRIHSLEIPAGKKEKKESIRECARRELQEETGFKAGKLIKLITYYPAVSYSTEKLTIFLAGSLLSSRGTPDRDEFIRIRVMSLDKVLDLIRKERIKDSKTVLAILYYAYFIKTKARV